MRFSGEMYRMEENRSSIKRHLEIVDEQKLGGFMACTIDEGNKRKLERPITLFQALTDRINKSNPDFRIS